METNNPKYYNPKSKKMEDMWETLVPVYTVRYEMPEGKMVYITLEAQNEEEAKDKAMVNPKFIEHIPIKDFDREYLTAYKPSGLYVIGRVEYFEGDLLA